MGQVVHTCVLHTFLFTVSIITPSVQLSRVYMIDLGDHKHVYMYVCVCVCVYQKSSELGIWFTTNL